MARLFVGNFEQPCQDKMDSYPHRATVVGIPAFRAFNDLTRSFSAEPAG